MTCLLRRTWFAPTSLLACGILLTASAWAKEKGASPEINKPYKNADVSQFVERFETESREVFAHRKEIVAACRIKPGMIVADIGAGTGLFTRLFAAEVGPKGRVEAVDITPKFLEHIRKTCQEAGIANVHTVLCTSDSTELPANSVDLAFICDVYHHLESPQKTMASIHRALRPGGRLILIEFCRIEGKTPPSMMEHVRAGQEVFTQEIESAGFKKVDEVNLLKDNYFVRFERVAVPTR